MYRAAVGGNSENILALMWCVEIWLWWGDKGVRRSSWPILINECVKVIGMLLVVERSRDYRLLNIGSR